MNISPNQWKIWQTPRASAPDQGHQPKDGMLPVRTSQSPKAGSNEKVLFGDQFHQLRDMAAPEYVSALQDRLQSDARLYKGRDCRSCPRICTK